MSSHYKTLTIQERVAIWKVEEAEKAEAAKVRFNNIAARKARIEARKAEREGKEVDSGVQMRLF